MLPVFFVFLQLGNDLSQFVSLQFVPMVLACIDIKINEDLTRPKKGKDLHQFDAQSLLRRMLTIKMMAVSASIISNPGC